MIKVMFMVLAMLIPAMSCSMNQTKTFVTYQKELSDLLAKKSWDEADIKNAQGIIQTMKNYFSNKNSTIASLEEQVQKKQNQFGVQKSHQKIEPSSVVVPSEVESVISKVSAASTLLSSSPTIPQEPAQQPVTKTSAYSLHEDSSSKKTEQSWSILGWIKRLLPAINQQISSVVSVIRSHIARLWSLEKKETVSGAPENTALQTEAKKVDILSGRELRKPLESFKKTTLPSRRTPNKSTKNLPSNDSLSTNASSWPE